MAQELVAYIGLYICRWQDIKRQGKLLIEAMSALLRRKVNLPKQLAFYCMTQEAHLDGIEVLFQLLPMCIVRCPV